MAATIPILVVEDEPAIQRGLCDVLAFRGFAPHAVDTGEDGLASGQTGRYALVLLDVMLPGISGFEVCAQLRQSLPRLPILLLTARGREQDVLEGFRAGADDYVTKPFSVAELLARIEALLRRAGGTEAPAPAPFAFGDLELDPSRLRAERGARGFDVTRRECGILALLARERGRIVSRRALLAEVWGAPSPDRLETRTVDMHIAKLRRKLQAAGAGELIETVRGEGYRYTG